MRFPSGIGTMSKEIVEGTCQRINWIQVGAAINHPENGKLFDMSQFVSQQTGVTDPSVRLIPYNSYGDENIIRQVLDSEKIDAIMIFTDPRFFIWLFHMEHELRQRVPIIYLNIWDNVPAPSYNKNFYESCDALMGISKQTVNINKMVLGNSSEYYDIDLNEQSIVNKPQISYVPHGINPVKFHPILETDDDYSKVLELKKKLFGDMTPNFVMLYNNRNIRRKMPSNVMEAFQKFVNMLPKDDRDKCVLIMHTQPVDENGTDLIAVYKELMSEVKIVFSQQKIDASDLNLLYNMCDVTVNLANAEGFGLATAESLMAGVPIIATVTGGLQDQMRFVDENGKLVVFSPEWPSNQDGRYKEHGEWAFPVFPVTNTLNGSPLTPFIRDSFINNDDAASIYYEVYQLGKDELKRRGLAGREWILTDESGMNSIYMCSKFINDTETLLENWVPRNRYNIYTI